MIFENFFMAFLESISLLLQVLIDDKVVYIFQDLTKMRCKLRIVIVIIIVVVLYRE